MTLPAHDCGYSERPGLNYVSNIGGVIQKMQPFFITFHCCIP